MPTLSSPLLPQVTGLALGSNSQQWAIYGYLVGGSQGVSLSSLTSTSTMNFTGFTFYEVLLTTNVTLSNFAGSVGYYAFVVTQDGIGSHTFAWPAGFVNASSVSPTANGSLTQVFLWDGTHGFAIAPGMVFP